MLPSSNNDVPFYTNTPTRISHVISYVDFNQDDENHISGLNRNEYPIASSVFVQQLTRQETQPPIPTLRDSNSSLVASSVVKETIINLPDEKEEIKSKRISTADDVKQSSTASTPPSQIFRQPILTTERSQQTSPLAMSLLDDDDDNLTPLEDHHNKNHLQQRRTLSEQRQSRNSIVKRSSSEENPSTLRIEDDFEMPNEIKTLITPRTIPISQRKPIPKIKPSSKIASSSTTSLPKNNRSALSKFTNSLDTNRTLALVPSITRRGVQGVLVRFFRNGEEYHQGVKIAINESDLKSWEAFLNYLNQQSKLVLSTGGIRHIYTLNGKEIRSINKFQHRQSYVVSSGHFTRTNYRYANDAFAEESDINFNYTNNKQQETVPYWNTRISMHPRWRSPPAPIGEQIFILPYSKLNMHESLILNRNLPQIFDDWLKDQVSDLLSHYTNNEFITHLFGVTKLTFIEIKSFSKLFHMIKITDTFIGCTEDEYVHAKHYFETMKPNELFYDRIWPRKALNGSYQVYPYKSMMEDAKLNLNWIHGYNGESDITKKLYTLPENEILYVIGSVCILYDPILKQQRFYTKHNRSITAVDIHQCQSLVASSEIATSKSCPRALIHIWDHVNLKTITEIRKEQFGSFVNVLTFAPKSDDTLLLIVSRDKPQIVLFVDWKRNELIYSISCKSDNILSVLFVFDTTEWIACISQRHLLFFHINWSLRPLRMLDRREAEVQNVYTGAAACDIEGDRLLVGDKVGSVHVWRLVDNEPRLVGVQENLLENDVEIIASISSEAFVLANDENQIKVWNVKFNTIEQIRLNETIGSIRSICCIRQGSNTSALAIGTKSNYIISKEIGNEHFDIIMRGHTSPSICICCDKDNQYFFSISSDRHLFKWNNRTKTVQWVAKSTQPISCADIHPERNIIVLGSETSKLLIYDTLSSYYIATITLKMNAGVKSVRFSPDGFHLATGSQNGSVCIFDVLGNGDFHLRNDGILQNDCAAVSDIVWSIDSKYLLAVYADNDYNIWSLPSFEIVRGKTIENIEWHQVVHPVMCKILVKSAVDAHRSAITLSSTLALCCGKDGNLRLFRNRLERNAHTFQFPLGSVHSITPSMTENTFLLTMTDTPVIAEIEMKINTYTP